MSLELRATAALFKALHIFVFDAIHSSLLSNALDPWKSVPAKFLVECGAKESHSAIFANSNLVLVIRMRISCKICWIII